MYLKQLWALLLRRVHLFEAIIIKEGPYIRSSYEHYH